MGVCQHIAKGDHLRRRADSLIETARSTQSLSSMTRSKGLSTSQQVKAGYQQHKRAASQWRAENRSR